MCIFTSKCVCFLSVFQKIEVAKEFKAIFEECQEKLRQGWFSQFACLRSDGKLQVFPINMPDPIWKHFGFWNLMESTGSFNMRKTAVLPPLGSAMELRTVLTCMITHTCMGSGNL